MDLLEVTRKLSEQVDPLRFSEPVTHVYNPLRYAWQSHANYFEKYARPGVDAILVGMNPGPWGMAQTGIPFGEVAAARDWLKVEAPVGKPRQEHPKRPVEGFQSARSEVSGRRLWGWARERFESPERFFNMFFVVNYCPLAFLEATGRNRTPDKLPAVETKPLFKACDEALRGIVDCLRPTMVIGVGAFAEKKAKHVLGDANVSFGRVLHPSPASPAANRGWAEQATAQLRALGLEIP